MSEAPIADVRFAPIAQRVLVRVILRRWLGLLKRTLWHIATVEAFLVGWQFAGGSLATPWLAWSTLIAWVAGSLLFAGWRKPDTYAALALWDQTAGRREAFASAWWFGQQSQLSEAQRHHVEAQYLQATAALPELSKDLPLSPSPRLLLGPALAVAVSLMAAVANRPATDLTMDAEMQRLAQEEARKLAATDWEKKKLAGLNSQEQEEVNKLKETLKQTAQDLEKSGGKNAREVMANLEKRARDAEKLAEQIGADKDAWASEKLTQALRRQADTADLGDAVAARNAASAAKAAQALADELKAPQLTHDVRERLSEALKETQREAEKEDRQRVVGQHVLSAGDELQKGAPQPAGAEFEKLAEKMRDMARRDQTRKELEKLAQQLRDAGSNIAGQSKAGGMQEMAAAGQQAQQTKPGSVPQVGQAQAGQSGQSQLGLQPPGLSQAPQAQQMMMSPVPGTNQQQPQQMMMAQGQPGKQEQGQPMLLAPVPGMKPGEQPKAFLLGPQGEQPSEGPMVALSMPGGNTAGVGKADLNANATARQKSGNEAVVAGQQNTEGQSTVRAVEGGTRKEAAGRNATQIAVDFIEAEEAALDEAALPPSRREQVRRYFTELRKRFEKTE